MKKIMFNDKYGLTQAVLEGRKTQTRRIADTAGRLEGLTVRQDLGGVNKGRVCLFDNGIILTQSAYKLSETIAIAQKYEDLKKNDEFLCLCGKNGMSLGRIIYEEGCFNKMFVRAVLMPHHIRITNIRVERMQDISEADCLKEGIKEIYERGTDDPSEFYGYAYLPDATPCVDETYNYPQEAYASLIDRISGKGTWESNPYVFVYDFELID